MATSVNLALFNRFSRDVNDKIKCLFHFGVVSDEERIEPFSSVSGTLSGVERDMYERHADVIGKPFDEIPSDWSYIVDVTTDFTNKVMIIKAEKTKQFLHADADFSESDETDALPLRKKRHEVKINSCMPLLRLRVLTPECIIFESADPKCGVDQWQTYT